MTLLHVGRQRRNKVPHQLIKECGGGALGSGWFTVLDLVSAGLVYDPYENSNNSRLRKGAHNPNSQ